MGDTRGFYTGVVLNHRICIVTSLGIINPLNYLRYESALVYIEGTLLPVREGTKDSPTTTVYQYQVGAHLPACLSIAQLVACFSMWCRLCFCGHLLAVSLVALQAIHPTRFHYYLFTLFLFLFDCFTVTVKLPS